MKTHPSIQEIMKHAAPGVKFCGFENSAPTCAKIAQVQKPKKEYHESGGKPHIESILQKHSLIFVKELEFAKPRRFAFDYAVPKFALYIEYEGLVKGGKGGHQTIQGFNSNIEKYNLACVLGWSGLRFTANNYEDFEGLLMQFLMKIK